MAFPNSFECKFSSIDARPYTTLTTVRVYRVSDGGIVNGQQQYIRTLFRSLSLRLDAGLDKQRLIDYFLAKLNDLNVQFSLGYTPDRFICTL